MKTCQHLFDCKKAGRTMCSACMLRVRSAIKTGIQTGNEKVLRERKAEQDEQRKQNKG
jgi:hypothetical protein